MAWAAALLIALQVDALRGRSADLTRLPVLDEASEQTSTATLLSLLEQTLDKRDPNFGRFLKLFGHNDSQITPWKGNRKHTVKIMPFKRGNITSIALVLTPSSSENDTAFDRVIEADGVTTFIESDDRSNDMGLANDHESEEYWDQDNNGSTTDKDVMYMTPNTKLNSELEGGSEYITNEYHDDEESEIDKLGPNFTYYSSPESDKSVNYFGSSDDISKENLNGDFKVDIYKHGEIYDEAVGSMDSGFDESNETEKIQNKQVNTDTVINIKQNSLAPNVDNSANDADKIVLYRAIPRDHQSHTTQSLEKYYGDVFESDNVPHQVHVHSDSVGDDHLHFTRIPIDHSTDDNNNRENNSHDKMSDNFENNHPFLDRNYSTITPDKKHNITSHILSNNYAEDKEDVAINDNDMQTKQTQLEDISQREETSARTLKADSESYTENPQDNTNRVSITRLKEDKVDHTGSQRDHSEKGQAKFYTPKDDHDVSSDLKRLNGTGTFKNDHHSEHDNPKGHRVEVAQEANHSHAMLKADKLDSAAEGVRGDNRSENQDGALLGSGKQAHSHDEETNRGDATCECNGAAEVLGALTSRGAPPETGRGPSDAEDGGDAARVLCRRYFHLILRLS